MGDVVFIDIESNASAYNAEPIDELYDIGIPANTIREWFVRLGNVSGATVTNVPISFEGQHPSRLQVSFSEFGSYSDSLILTSLGDGKSKNLYIKLTMPLTVQDEAVVTNLVVGSQRLPIRYQAASALNTLTDPYPMYDGDITADIFKLFENKPVHRFMRYEPIENLTGSNPDKSGKVRLSDLDVCSYFDPNDHRVGYEQPICKDLVCIPTAKELETLERWTAEDGTYEYGDHSLLFLKPDYLNELGYAPPQWRLYHTETSAATTNSIPAILGSPLGLERYKRSQFVMLRMGIMYSLEHLHPVMRGQSIAYYKATLRRIYAPEGTNPYGYNPFSCTYEDGTDRVITRYPCWNLPAAVDVPGSTGGTGEATTPASACTAVNPATTVTTQASCPPVSCFNVNEARETKNVYVESPTASENIPLWITESNIIITEIRGITDVGTVTFNVVNRDTTSPFTGGVVVNSADIVADTDGAIQSGFAQTIVPQGRWLTLTTSATSGSTTKLHISVKYLQTIE